MQILCSFISGTWAFTYCGIWRVLEPTPHDGCRGMTVSMSMSDKNKNKNKNKKTKKKTGYESPVITKYLKLNKNTILSTFVGCHLNSTEGKMYSTKCLYSKRRNSI